MNVLLSIKPEFAKKILSNRKRYEFRRTPMTKADSINKVILYASSPTQRIVGFFEINQVVCETPERLWEQYEEKSGIDEQDRFMNYFSGCQEGYAFEITNPQRLRSAIDPWEHIREFTPPVSFQYVNNGFNMVFDCDSVETTAAGD